MRMVYHCGQIERVLHLLERKLFVITCHDFSLVLKHRGFIMFLRHETDILHIMLYSCQNQFVISITSKVIFLIDIFVLGLYIWEEW